MANNNPGLPNMSRRRIDGRSPPPTTNSGFLRAPDSPPSAEELELLHNETTQSDPTPDMLQMITCSHYAQHFYIKIRDIIGPKSYKRYSRHVPISQDYIGTGKVHLEFRGDDQAPTTSSAEDLAGLDGSGIRGAKAADAVALWNSAMRELAAIKRGTRTLYFAPYYIEIMEPQSDRSCEVGYDRNGELYIPTPNLSWSSSAGEPKQQKITLYNDGGQDVELKGTIKNSLHLAFDVINKDSVNSVYVKFHVAGTLYLENTVFQQYRENNRRRRENENR